MNTAKAHNAPLGYVSASLVQVVPNELQALAQWICWVAGPVKPDGKFDKFPKGKDGTGTAWPQPAQWMNLPEALDAAKSRGHSGVGLVLPAQTPNGMHVVALDFDGVNLDQRGDPRVKEIQDLHERLDHPYIEISPSGKGIRMFVLSTDPIEQVSAPNPLGGKDELFCANGRWITVTGDRLAGSDIPEATETVRHLANLLKSRSSPLTIRGSTQQVAPASPLNNLTKGWQGWPAQKLRDGDGREAIMLSYAGHLRAKGLDQEDIERLCLEANVEHYADRLDVDVVLDRARRFEDHADEAHPTVVDSVLEQVDQTDAGNVARLHQLTLGDIRYVHEAGIWIYWTGSRWEYDHSWSALHRQTLRVAATYARKAARLQKEIDDPSTSDQQRKALRDAVKSLHKWVAQCRNRTRIDAMIALAKKDPRFVISAGELDRDPYLFGVANGVVCLRTGTLRPDSKADYILRRSGVNFNPSASTANFKKFIDDVTSGPDGLENGKVKPKARPLLASHLQKVGGYCLTGLTREQVMFMPTGKGANGKNVWVDVLKEVMGDYCEVIQPEILLATKAASSAEQASPSTRKLAGARCAITSENKEGAQLDVAVVKRHTGDSKMTARGLYERPITFDITHKLILLTNHPPRVDHIDDAIKGRLQVIPFDMRWNRPGSTDFDPILPDADKDLLAKLKSDAEGVLLYLVQGAVLYFREGLTPPSEVTAFTQGYISGQDTVRRWVEEDCVPCSFEEGFTAAHLHSLYRAFCASEGEPVQARDAAALGRRLKQLGYSSQRTREGARYALKPREGINAGAVGAI
jgi:putative DNA primase/helicase